MQLMVTKVEVKPNIMRNVKRSANWSQLLVRGSFTMALAVLLFAGFQSSKIPHLGNTPDITGMPAVATRSIAAATAFAPAPPGESPPSALPPPQNKLAASTNYVGDEVCGSCHQDKTSTYHQTAHHITSRLPTRDSIAGKFGPGSNILETLNTNLYFKMEANEEGFFQSAMLRHSLTHAIQQTERFDVVVGSGRKGQTYLFWRDSDLIELPVSYWVELGEWGNSPGYVDGNVRFNRAIVPRCLECHSSSFEELGPPAYRYNRTSLVLGITCEKCHGPGREHVARFQSPTPPQSPAETAIINPARFSRDRQVDACALCHAGMGIPIAPALSFVPGDVLSNYVYLPKIDVDTAVDVHGKQVELLSKSRCFQSSPTMTCSSCHDAHKPQRDLAAFTTSCLACHKIEKCGEFAKLGHKIDNNCVTCHMPLQQTGAIIARVNGSVWQPKVRNHQIAIYPDIHLP